MPHDEIWRRIRIEATEAADTEPALASSNTCCGGMRTRCTTRPGTTVTALPENSSICWSQFPI